MINQHFLHHLHSFTPSQLSHPAVTSTTTTTITNTTTQPSFLLTYIHPSSHSLTALRQTLPVTSLSPSTNPPPPPDLLLHNTPYHPFLPCPLQSLTVPSSFPPSRPAPFPSLGGFVRATISTFVDRSKRCAERLVFVAARGLFRGDDCVSEYIFCVAPV
ncbi:hypothetical protein E2C01_017219 [Portunus trituberculatus]|uniref:Uncharacterized protein n=1 Tax=Portunus trituberculatus TaxID=210409 RepID=A0A5B7DT64_PORTR|nr:hypothetical protein [Portunus trituberculatus]